MARRWLAPAINILGAAVSFAIFLMDVALAEGTDRWMAFVPAMTVALTFTGLNLGLLAMNLRRNRRLAEWEASLENHLTDL